MNLRTWFIMSLVCLCLMLVSCQQTQNVYRSSSPADGAEHWIQSTSPQDGAANVASKTPIVLSFNQQMDASGLNSTSIQVLSGKYGDRASHQKMSTDMRLVSRPNKADLK